MPAQCEPGAWPLPDPDAAANARVYARCIRAAKKVRWDVEADVVRGRSFEPRHELLPEGLTLVGQLPFLDRRQALFLSRIQGRTYANVLGVLERFIGVKMLEIGSDYWLGDQTALEALVRCGAEELKHQALFRRVAALAARGMPEGYVFDHDADHVARAVLGMSTWSVLALTCHVERSTHVHYRHAIAAHARLSGLFKDVLTFHWKEGKQHARLGELEWRREHARLSDDERDGAVYELIELYGALDGILRAQARADARYFAGACGEALAPEHHARVEAVLTKAYRRQHLGSGAEHRRHARVLQELTTPAQRERLRRALAPFAA